MVVIGIVWLLTTATLTYAAGEKLTTPGSLMYSEAGAWQR